MRDRRAAGGAAAGGTWRLAPLSPRPAPPSLPPPAEEAPGKFGYPSLSPERDLGGATWEEVVAWKPSEVAKGTKAIFILKTGTRALGAGAGAGAEPQVSSHFREVFLLRGQRHPEQGPDSSLGYLETPFWGTKSLCRPWAKPILLCVLLDETK